MPNHFLGLLLLGITQQDGALEHETDDNPRLGAVVGAFKSDTTFRYIQGVRKLGWNPFPKRLWQRNYYERVVRNELEFHTIQRYIMTNPERWNRDRENGDRIGRDEFDIWLETL